MSKPGDPRRDLYGDSALWDDVLISESGQSKEDVNGLYGALHGLRCWGAELRQDKSGRLRLGPGEMDDPTYQRFRSTYLVPHADQLTELLAGKSQVRR